MSEYRAHKGSTLDLETAALHELAHRVKQLRKRILFPIAAAAVIAGHLGIAAHALGYWSVFGDLGDGTYFFSPFTLATAFVLCAAPFAIVGLIVHRVLSARLRREWCDEFEKKYRLPREMLERNAGRYG